jgi:hypothetical protein
MMSENKLMKREIQFCEDCYNLKSEECHEPECIFCFKGMKEVADILDALLIRPVADGVRLKC